MAAPSDESPKVDVAERAGHHTGNPQVLETRLFMQLLVFDCAPELAPEEAIESLAAELGGREVQAVIYEDVNAPRGVGLLTWSEDPAHFVEKVRPAILAVGGGLVPRRDFSMLGRTYATGYEPDLRYWLLQRPVDTALNEAWPWAVWYPLRRIGAFNRLEGREQGSILKEHGTIGRAYGEQDLAHDIRLACHGLDTDDNEFVVALVGKDLHPLSHVVQAMRKTRQTAEFMEKMGPFFVGHAVRRVA
jgi:chlorite dismutase